MTVSFEPLWRILDGLVHGSVAGDALARLRHRSFIASHLAAGLFALLAFPVWLAVAGRPSLITAIAFFWLVAPLPVAAFLSRTGRFGAAQLLSAVSIAGLALWIAIFTGGPASPVLVWLAVVPAEAAMSASRRMTAASVLLAAAVLAVLAGANSLGWLPAAAPLPPAFPALMVAGAIAYAGLLALRIGRNHAEAEAAARRGESRYRLFADNSTDLITSHGASGDVEFASPAARPIAGCGPSELLGRGLFDRVHVADRPAYLRALSEADRTGAVVAVEFRLRRDEDGRTARYAWLEMRCRPAFDAAGGRRSIVAVTRDITERKDQASAFEKARSDAEAANLAKGQFLATISHELRTPLNAIIGFSDMLEQELVGRFEFDRHREYARLIHASGDHLLEVVNGILDMSKIEAGSFGIIAEPFPVAPLVDGAVEMMSHQIRQRGLRLVRRVPANLPDLVADRRACRQILLNLLSNAVKFTEAGGTITVAVEAERDWLSFKVADTGIGIAGADLVRLGTPFVQADANYARRYQGTGLGLSVVKGLATLHGGTLLIDSELGEGTTVTVRLPIRAVAPETRADDEPRELKRA